MSTLLETIDLSIRIGHTTVCKHLDLQVNAGQSWALLGGNGSGKTTLLHHFGGLADLADGTILLAGSPVAGYAARERARKVGILLQHSSRGFGGRVRDNVLNGRHPHQSALAWEGRDDLCIANRSMDLLDLGNLAGRDLSTLSGGELRRVEIARLLTQQTPLTLLDEPLNHLDPAHQSLVLRVLQQQCVNDERAILAVMHDINLAYRACDHWLLLDGRGGWHAGPREAMGDPVLLSKVFGHTVERLETQNMPVFLPSL
jgi:iron complex transport system ATP-binding protein